MSDAYLADSARDPAFNGGNSTGNSRSDGELSERSEYAIAFVVLLFFGALGWWLMQPEGAAPTLAGGQSDSVDYRFEREPVVAAPRPARERTPESVAAATVQPAAQAEPVVVGEAEEMGEMGDIEMKVAPLAPKEEPMVEPVVAPVEPAVETEIFREVLLPVQDQEPVIEEAVEPVEVVEPVVEEPVETESELFQRATTNVRFVTASSDLTEPSKAILDDIFALVQSRPDSKLRIVGHTDSQGDADKNARLSYARAEACRSYLLEKGLTVERVNAAGFGELQPIASNLTAEGRRENRRVEFELVPLE